MNGIHLDDVSDALRSACGSSGQSPTYAVKNWLKITHPTITTRIVRHRLFLLTLDGRAEKLDTGSSANLMWAAVPPSNRAAPTEMAGCS